MVGSPFATTYTILHILKSFRSPATNILLCKISTFLFISLAEKGGDQVMDAGCDMVK